MRVRLYVNGEIVEKDGQFYVCVVVMVEKPHTIYVEVEINRDRVKYLESIGAYIFHAPNAKGSKV